MPTTIYDSSKLIERKANKTISGDFIRRINQQNTTGYAPYLGINTNSILNNVIMGQIKDINKCEGGFNTDNGCPCLS